MLLDLLRTCHSLKESVFILKCTFVTKSFSPCVQYGSLIKEPPFIVVVDARCWPHFKKMALASSNQRCSNYKLFVAQYRDVGLQRMFPLYLPVRH